MRPYGHETEEKGVMRICALSLSQNIKYSEAVKVYHDCFSADENQEENLEVFLSLNRSRRRRPAFGWLASVH